MHNNSLFDKLAIVDFIIDVEPKDFVVMSKVAVRWLFRDDDGLTSEQFSQEELDFIKLLEVRDELDFFWTVFSDIKFAEGEGFIKHEQARELLYHTAGLFKSDDLFLANRAKCEVLKCLDDAAYARNKFSLDMMRHDRSIIRLDDNFSTN